MTTDKVSVRILTRLLVAHGITDVVVSPGTRNVPLVIAFEREARLKTHIVIDERSAAFVALGIADISGRAVAIACTSGTALLNYAPAVAEAYYRGIPLVVISADRPAEWIDQDDSQTIRQPGALANYVKGTYEIAYDTPTDTQRWFINRRINDALINATEGRRGPVHINLSLDEPLNGTSDCTHDVQDARCISLTEPERVLPRETAVRLAQELSSKRVMVIAGFHAPDVRLGRAIGKLAQRPNFVVLHEAQSNIHAPGLIGNIDGTLCHLSKDLRARYAPELVITIGGSLVSRMVKTYIRSLPDTEHWSVGLHNHAIDCFKGRLSRRIVMDEAAFAEQISEQMPPCNDGDREFKQTYAQASHLAYERASAMAATSEWCDFTAFARIVKSVPGNWNVQLSNGTSIRYMQLFPYGHIRRIDCNRGVSGIDGCTSTALGASTAYHDVTLLVTGDMSAQYDIGALASTLMSPRLKIIVLNNQGGGIFRFIKTTRDLPELERCLAAEVRLPLRRLAEAYDIAYFEASDESSLAGILPDFVAESVRPAILNVITPPEISPKVLIEYFNYK